MYKFIMTLTKFDKELIYSSVEHILLSSYINTNKPLSSNDVVKRLEEKMTLSNEMQEYAISATAEWVAHFEQKKNEYVQKSKFVSWCTDATYDLSME